MDVVTVPEGVIGRLLAEAQDDEVGLWEIVREVEARTGPSASTMEETLAVVRELLSHGLQAGDPPYSAGGYRAWADQAPDAVIDRIRREWVALGRTPNIPDIAWFGLRG